MRKVFVILLLGSAVVFQYCSSSNSMYFPKFASFISIIYYLQEPKSYFQAVKSLEWQKAMSEELEAFRRTHTWDIVPMPPGANPVSCKWVYKIKTKADGSVERYKARLVARGFTQEYGIDYEETFAPIAKVTPIRTLIASTAARKWPFYQMDVKNALLNSDLSEVVYMQPPPGAACPPRHVCRL